MFENMLDVFVFWTVMYEENRNKCIFLNFEHFFKRTHVQCSLQKCTLPYSNFVSECLFIIDSSILLKPKAVVKKKKKKKKKTFEYFFIGSEHP